LVPEAVRLNVPVPTAPTLYEAVTAVDALAASVTLVALKPVQVTFDDPVHVSAYVLDALPVFCTVKLAL
jgi:hypothetical protein